MPRAGLLRRAARLVSGMHATARPLCYSSPMEALMRGEDKGTTLLFEDCRQSVEWAARLREGGFSFEHSAAYKDGVAVPALHVRLHDVLEEFRFQSLIIESWEVPDGGH